jgi:hypothetical protein
MTGLRWLAFLLIAFFAAPPGLVAMPTYPALIPNGAEYVLSLLLAASAFTIRLGLGGSPVARAAYVPGVFGNSAFSSVFTAPA